MLATDGAQPVRCRDWSHARELAEGSRQNNPLDVFTATAAAGGMAMAMRSFLMNNPGDPPDDAQVVLRVVPSQWLARAPRRDRYGNVWLLARRGYRRRVKRAARRARLPFPVQVMEAV
jgi:hypothetical protein